MHDEKHCEVDALVTCTHGKYTSNEESHTPQPSLPPKHHKVILLVSESGEALYSTMIRTLHH